MLSDLMEFEKLKHEIEEKERTRPADDIKKKIPIPDHVPVGNKLAHFIRSIHWNSKGMFPSTAGSQRTYDKYHTVTQLSFSGPNGFNIEPGEVDGVSMQGHVRILRGTEGPDPPPPLENYKNIRFRPDPLRITKLPIQHSMLGLHRPASKTPFKWRFAGGSMIARL